jgi:hypothetical protein
MAHPDLEALFNTLLPFTQKLLGKHGGFNPWGAIMWASGEIQWVAADNGEEFPEAQELIDLLTEAFSRPSCRGVLRAVGMCYDVLVTPSGQAEKLDAICCRLEHVSGEAVDVFVPYRKTDEGVRYADAFTWLREPQFFLPTKQ